MDEIKRALAQDEEVEFPYGRLKRVKKHYSKWWDDMDDWPAAREVYTVGEKLNEAG